MPYIIWNEFPQSAQQVYHIKINDKRNENGFFGPNTKACWIEYVDMDCDFCSANITDVLANFDTLEQVQEHFQGKEFATFKNYRNYAREMLDLKN